MTELEKLKQDWLLLPFKTVPVAGVQKGFLLRKYWKFVL
jgi:hypothetical protein